jgi:hypothetical protein
VPPSQAGAYQVGQVLLIEQSGLAGSFLPAILMELQHKYVNVNDSDPGESAAARKHSNMKEMSVLYRNNEISRLVVGGDDFLHCCQPSVVHGSDKKSNSTALPDVLETCQTSSILIFDPTSAIFSSSSRSTTGINVS